MFKQRRIWLIGGLLGLLVIFITIGIFGYFQQRAIFNNSDAQYGKAKSLMNTIFDTKASRNDRVAAIAELSKAKVTSKCDGEWWSSWQQGVFPAMKEASMACEKHRQHLIRSTRAAGIVTAYLRDDTAIAGQLQKLSSKSDLANWQQAALKTAEGVKTTIIGMHTTEDAKALQTQATKRVDAVVKGWNMLNDSSVKQDKTAYIEAEARLKQSYVDLGAIADESDAKLVKLLDSLRLAVSQK